MQKSKTCTRCKLEKLLECFYVRPERKTVRPRCKVCEIELRIQHGNKNSEQRNATWKRYYENNKDEFSTKRKEAYKNNKRKARNSQLLQKFGITIEQYEEQLEKQQNKCDCCARDRSEFRRDFAVDHNHKTGQLRGLICGPCNTALGSLKIDNGPTILDKAKVYYVRYEISGEETFNKAFVPSRKAS